MMGSSWSNGKELADFVILCLMSLREMKWSTVCFVMKLTSWRKGSIATNCHRLRE